jgi:hypothetical protein
MPNTSHHICQPSPNMQSPLPDIVLPQFSSVTVSDAARMVTSTRASASAGKTSNIPIDFRPLGNFSDSLQRLGSRPDSAFARIPSERLPLPFSHIESSIQFPSFETDSQDCTVHSLDENADDDGFFLLAPTTELLDPNDSNCYLRRNTSQSGSHFKDTQSPRPRVTSTRRSTRMSKFVLHPRPIKRNAAFV